MKFYLAIPDFLLNLGIGIYSAVILSNNSKGLVSTDIYAFVITICVIHFIASINRLYSFIQDKKSLSLTSFLISIGLFIWSCVILFAQNGIDYKSTNPYYMVVFVYFIICVIPIGIVLIILPFIICAMCYNSGKEDTINQAKTIEMLNNTIKECELVLAKAKANNTATAPTVPTASNTTVELSL